MNRKTKIVLGIVMGVTLLVSTRLFHVGPFGVRLGDDIVLAHSALSNGARLLVVAHRVDSWVEPYEVTLYRVEPEGEIFAYWMGYEDSFWWGCSMGPDPDPTLIQIRVYRVAFAFYKVTDHSLTFIDDHYHYGIQKGYKLEDGQLPPVVKNGRDQLRTKNQDGDQSNPPLEPLGKGN